jgi:hypothetical protein
MVSERLLEEDRKLLGLDAPLRVAGLADGHRRFLEWHRREEFKA